MTLTAKHIESVLRSIPRAYGNQRATTAALASGANEALRSAPAGLTVQGAAAFLATMAQESGSFRYLEEIRKDGRYAPYIGRTFEQITWRDNYAAFGAWCAGRGLITDQDAFVKTPTLLANIRWAWLGGIWFWQKNGIWAYGNRGDFLATQRAVNLGNPRSNATPVGMTARTAWYAAWLKVGDDLLPSAPPTTPTPTPEVPDVAKVKFRGGWTCSCVATSLPLVEQDMIRRGLIKQSIDIFQLGYRPGGTAASAGTHDEGGCTDVDQYSDAQIKVWREWGWTMQKRVGVGSGTHAHGWPYRCPHLAPDAQAQERDWDRKDAGLVGTGRVGGLWPIDDWKTAMKKRLAQIAEDEKQKELELPTTAEVVKAVAPAVRKELMASVEFRQGIANAILTLDGVIKNNFTGNPANAFVGLDTALEVLGARTAQLAKIEAKLDALTAAVAAAFPGSTPPAA